MSMNPRLLRPTASGFTPRSISGLALWLDASDSSTLFQNSDGTVPATATSDPVGYWGDKSGNGRHAVQATAGSRPTISATAQNGRKQLLFDGTNDRLSLSSGLSLGTTGYSVLAVLRHSGGFTVWLEGGSLNPYFSTHPSINTGLYHWDGAVAVEATAALPVGSAAVVSGIIAPSSRALYSQSALAVTGAGTSRAATIQNIGATSSGFFWNGNIDELLVYSKVLTTTERQRLERYLSARWGITLAPTVANADAQDWVNRVYANGGTVSSATAQAVNSLCDSLESASLRDRFYRLNLFCGSNLNAALVPLYLTPDKTVTNLFQFGTDMSNAVWQPGGNGAWTRTATTEVGPLGYGSATKFTTPSAPFDVRQMHQLLPVQNRQVTLSVWLKTNTGTRQVQWFINGEYLDTITVTSTWTRYTKTHTSTVSAADGRSGLVTVSELSDAAGFIYGWGMQAEFGPTATSYNQPRYGSTTDTNVGPFVSGDFADATGLAAGSGKYLRTGLTQVSVGVACHLAFYDCAKATSSYGNRIGSRGVSGANEHLMTNLDVSTTIDYGSSAVSGNHRARATGYTESGAFWMGVNPTSASAILYKNGVSAATATPSARTAQSLEYYVFALNSNGSLADPTTTGRSGGYSIGTAMDATEASAYNTAMQAFQAALTRNA